MAPEPPTAKRCSITPLTRKLASFVELAAEEVEGGGEPPVDHALARPLYRNVIPGSAYTGPRRRRR
jgi:hypothetical protein